MKTITYLSAFLFYIIPLIGTSQIGESCSNPHLIQSSTNEVWNEYTTSSLYTWFLFTATSEQVRLRIESTDFAEDVAHVHSVSILSGNCSNPELMNLIQSDELAFVDSTHFLFVDIINPKLNIGQDYYILVTRSSITGVCNKPACIYDSCSAPSPFGISLRELDISYPAELPRLDVISNRNFERNRGQLQNLEGSMIRDILYWSQGHYPESYLYENSVSFVWTKIDTNQVQDSVHRIDLTFPQSQPNLEVFESNLAQGYNNYYLSHAPEGILKNQCYNRIIHKELYPNIDLHQFIENDKLHYQFILHPQADLNNIELLFSGAKNTSVNPDESLSIISEFGEMRLTKPKLLLEDGANLIELPNSVGYLWQAPDHYKFSIDRSPAEQTLIIDFEQMVESNFVEKGPEDLNWSTYIGGASGADKLWDMEIDQLGNLYAGGESLSASFPTNGAGVYSLTLANNPGFGDGVLVKFNDIHEKEWATYYGGSSIDGIFGIGYDALNDVIYTGGITLTNDNSLTSQVLASNPASYSDPYNSSANGIQRRSYFARFNNQGAREWATYFKGNDAFSAGVFVETDDAGNVYFVGNEKYPGSTGQVGTISNTPLPNGDMPIAAQNGNSYQQFYSGENDCYIVKFNSNLDLLWSTYLGSSSDDIVYDIVVDDVYDYLYLVGKSSGNIDVSCPTLNTSGDFPLCDAGGYYSENASGFVSRFSLSGELLWSTKFGGSNDQTVITGVDTDAEGTVYITGATSNQIYSNDMCSEPTDTGFPNCGSGTGGYFQNPSGGGDHFVARFREIPILTWATLIGGAASESGGPKINVNDDAKSLYIFGQTTSGSSDFTPSSFPTQISSDFYFKGTHNDYPYTLPRVDCYVMNFSLLSKELLHSTYFGGTLPNGGQGNNVEVNGTILGSGDKLYICGNTLSTTDFPIACPSAGSPYCQASISSGASGNTDGFIAELSLALVSHNEIQNSLLTSDSELTIYPNPTTGNITISWDDKGHRVERTSIFDNVGKIHIDSRAKGIGEIKLDISHLSVGIYYVKVLLENGKVSTGKLVLR